MSGNVEGRRPRPRREEGRQGQEGGAPPRRLLPAPARLQVLRGEDRLHQLQGRPAAVAVHPGAGQDPAAPDFRHVREAPARAAGRDLARAPARADSVRHGLGAHHGSHSERTRRKPRPPRRRRQSHAGLRAELPAAAQARAGRAREQQAPDRAREEARRGERPGRAARPPKRSRRGIGALDIEIARRVGENDTLYGSVTSADIAQALKAKGFEIDKRKIDLPDPLKALGETTVPVKIHRDVTAQVKVRVVAERTVEAPREAPLLHGSGRLSAALQPREFRERPRRHGRRSARRR